MADNSAGRRLRVLMLGPLPPPVGGMASVVDNLRVALAEAVDLRVLNTVKTTPADRPLWVGIAAQLGLLARLAWACLGWRPDLVHVHTCSWFSFWRSGVDVLLARLLGRRVVLHIHGAQFRTFLDGLSPARVWLARRVFALTTRVVVLGAGWKVLLDAWTEPARVVVVPNGVPVPAQPRLTARSAGAPLRILCLANYERRKGQADLLQAVAPLAAAEPAAAAGARWAIDLPGFTAEPGERERLLALAAELGLADRVDLPGPVTGADKDARLAAADCFCLPSYDEGLPMAMLEAMALGLPVVVTAVGAIPEAVTDGQEGLLFAPGDIPALTAHLARLRADPVAAGAIGAAGRARVEREFSLARSAELLVKLYQQVRAGSRHLEQC